MNKWSWDDNFCFRVDFGLPVSSQLCDSLLEVSKNLVLQLSLPGFKNSSKLLKDSISWLWYIVKDINMRFQLNILFFQFCVFYFQMCNLASQTFIFSKDFTCVVYVFRKFNDRIWRVTKALRIRGFSVSFNFSRCFLIITWLERFSFFFSSGLNSNTGGTLPCTFW